MGCVQSNEGKTNKANQPIKSPGVNDNAPVTKTDMPTTPTTPKAPAPIVIPSPHSNANTIEPSVNSTSCISDRISYSQLSPDGQLKTLRPSEKEKRRSFTAKQASPDSNSPENVTTFLVTSTDRHGRRNSSSLKREGSSTRKNSQRRRSHSKSSLHPIAEPSGVQNCSARRASASVKRNSNLQPIEIIKKCTKTNVGFNQYIKVKRLGEGATAKVYLYTDKATGAEYAVKKYNRLMLKKKRFYSNDKSTGKLVVSSQWNKVEHELEVLRYIHSARNEKLSHIARVFEIVDDPECDHLFVVMEYGALGVLCKWDDALFTFDNSTLQTEQRARIYFLQILQALIGLREIGVIHRDIKPDNIIITSSGAKLIDFGEAIVLPHKFPEAFEQFQQAQISSTMPTDRISLSVTHSVSYAGSKGDETHGTTPETYFSPSTHTRPRLQPARSASRPRLSVSKNDVTMNTNVIDVSDLFGDDGNNTNNSNIYLDSKPQFPTSSSHSRTHSQTNSALFSPSNQSPPPQIASKPVTTSLNPRINLDHSPLINNDGSIETSMSRAGSHVPKTTFSNYWYKYAMLKQSPATPFFASPDSCTGEHNGFDNDLWALAVSLFCCICGSLPFLSIQSNPDATIAQTLEVIQKGAFVWPVRGAIPVSNQLKTLITWMLQVNPQDRPTIDMAQQHPWCNIPVDQI